MSPIVTEDDLTTIEVAANPVETPGRVLCSAGNRHFILDEPEFLGGPGEEMGAAETLVSSVAACAVALIELRAADEELPLTDLNAVVEATLKQNAEPVREDRTVFHTLTVALTLVGVDREQAETLVAVFKQNCPIFGTLSTAIPETTVEVTVHPE